MSELKGDTPEAGRGVGVIAETASGDVSSVNSTLNHSPSQSPMLDAALTWLGRGVPLVPLQPKSKIIVKGYGPYKRQITTPGESFYWFGEHRANLGLVCGGHAGLVVLDFDLLTEFEAWKYHNRELSGTYTVKTARGFHAYFFIGDVPSGKVGKIEVKGSGSVIMAAPSVHPSGVIYRPLVESASIFHADADFPLLSELSKKKPARGIVARAQSALTGRDDLIGRIKAAWPILPLAESMTKLTSGDGRWFHGLCPLPGHKDHKPSFWVDAERGVFGCYACQVRGDAVNLYALRNGLTVREAIRELAAKLPR
jgi:hypothetical protein